MILYQTFGLLLLIMMMMYVTSASTVEAMLSLSVRKSYFATMLQIAIM